MSKGIDLSKVAFDTAKNVHPAIKYILGLKISQDDKIKKINETIRLIGMDFYTQMFDASSEIFDSAAIGMTDYNQMTDQIERLSRKIVRNDNLGRQTYGLVDSFYHSALGKVQESAFRNAISLDRHPILTRTVVGKCCEWCGEMAGVHKNPTPDLFARHENCDCLFMTSGFKTRNGVLHNYKKSPANADLSSYEARTKIGVTQKYWDEKMEDSEKWFARNYTENIKWINKDKIGKDGKTKSTNDYVLLSNRKEYELKSPDKVKYSNIAHLIRSAVTKNPEVKRNFMISTQGRELSDGVRWQLERYNVRNPDNKVDEIRIFSKEGEEILKLIQ